MLIDAILCVGSKVGNYTYLLLELKYLIRDRSSISQRNRQILHKKNLPQL